MKKLSELYEGEGYDNIWVKGIKINSKEVEPGDIFVCVKGVTADRHDFIEEAISKGASCVVVDRSVTCSVPMVKVKNTENSDVDKLVFKIKIK